MELQVPSFRNYVALREGVTAQLGFERAHMEFVWSVYSKAGGGGDYDKLGQAWVAMGGTVQPGPNNRPRYFPPKSVPNPQGLGYEFIGGGGAYNRGKDDPVVFLPVNQKFLDAALRHELGHHATYHATRTGRGGNQYTLNKIIQGGVQNIAPKKQADTASLVGWLEYASRLTEKDAYGRQVVSKYRDMYPGKPFDLRLFRQMPDFRNYPVLRAYMTAAGSQDPMAVARELAASRQVVEAPTEEHIPAVQKFIKRANTFFRDVTAAVSKENEQQFGRNPVNAAQVGGQILRAYKLLVPNATTQNDKFLGKVRQAMADPKKAAEWHREIASAGDIRKWIQAKHQEWYNGPPGSAPMPVQHQVPARDGFADFFSAMAPNQYYTPPAADAQQALGRPRQQHTPPPTPAVVQQVASQPRQAPAAPARDGFDDFFSSMRVKPTLGKYAG